MTATIRLSLALLPLASYFVFLGVLHSGRRPRVVSGPVDVGCLAFALGGVIAFGPFGGLVINTVFPGPNLPAWLAMASLVGLITMMIASRARTRLIVYNVDGRELTDAVGRVMATFAVRVANTIHGYEDVHGRRGVTVDIGPRLGWGTVTAYGEAPEALIDAIRAGLRAQLAAKSQRSSPLRLLWFGLAGATIAILVLGIPLMSRHELPAAVRKIGR